MHPTEQPHNQALPKAVHRLGYTPVIVLCVVGAILSFLIFAALRQFEWGKVSFDLQIVTHTRSAGIEAELDIAEDATDAIANFCDVMDDATRDDFAKFSKWFVEEAPGLQVFAWMPRVPENHRAEFEVSAHRDGLTNFQITEWRGPGSFAQGGKKDEYFPIFFAAPVKGNEKLMGFDFNSDPQGKKLLAEARDSGNAVVAPRFLLPHKAGKSPVCVFLRPVYVKGHPTDTVEQRRQNLRGFVIGAFDFSEIVRKGLAEFPPEDVHIRFIDRSNPDKEDVFYTYCPVPDNCPCEQMVKQMMTSHGLSHTTDFELQIGGGTWQLVFIPGPMFVEWHRTWFPWIILFSGFMMDLFGGGILAATIHVALRNERAILNWIAALRQSEERYRLLVENIDLGIALVDPDYNVVAANVAHAKLFKKTPAEIIGTKCYREFEKRDAPCSHCHGQHAMTTGQPMEMETVGVRDDGTRFTVRIQAFRILDDAGRVTGFIEVVEDVTERKEAEHALQNYAEALEKANQVLEQCSQTAQSATQAKSEFLANMSHEIRTPLTAIMGYAGLLLGTLPRSSDEHQAVATIKRNGDYLLAIINDILDLSKIEAGKMEVASATCSPVQIIAELVSLMSVNADAKGLALEIEYVGPIPEAIHTDPIRLRQILINLIGNAVKFTETGKIRLVTRLISDPTGEPKLQMDVIDTGIGISDEQIARLFQPFSQADSSMTRRFGGTGLGLMISRRLAAMLGGDITIQSALNHGSTFRVTIAAGSLDGVRMIDSPNSVLLRRAQDDESEQIKLNCRILLAEDGPDNQRLISFLLRKAGAEVAVANNGRQAVEMTLAANSHPFDIVLMDIQMPIMDGYEAMRQLRKGGYEGPIIALTAHAMPQDIRQCVEAGADAHLSKPIDQGILLGEVARFVEAKKNLP